ncbi:MAG: DUF1700 domain-containing protein [Eubacteriales bacterium]|nr:DUF1700 domain-containing protein [Eubacteriales bacterium]
MSKEEFLRKLRERLSVLEEGELQDILGEYEQHIDMKTTAMPEEEAIADFGDIDKLAEEILEAYHVRSGAVGPGGSRGQAGFVQRACRAVREWGGCLGQRLSALFAAAGRFCARETERCRELFRGRRGGRKRGQGEEAADRENDGMPVPKTQAVGAQEAGIREAGTEAADRAAAKRCRPVKGLLQRLWRAFLTGCRLCLLCCLWCLRWSWNLGWIGIGIFCGIGACFVLFSVGLMAVLWAQGYPTAGLFVACLGGAMCSVSLTGLCFTLIWRRKREQATEQVESFREDKEEEHA